MPVTVDAETTPHRTTTEDVRLVEVEVMLNDGVAASDVNATVQRLAANARGITSSVDAGAHRAVIVLPASRVAGLKKEGVVSSAGPSQTSSGKYRLQPLKPVTMTATPWSAAYAYDPAGNITAIGADTYTYDGVNRLITSHTNTVSQNFTYDKFGNRKTADVLAGQCSGASDCALAVSVSDTSGNRLISTTKNGSTQAASYDVAGEMTGLGAVTFTWDALGMMTSRSDALYRQFVYDENDERIGTFYEENWTWTLRDTANRVIREYSTGTSPAGHPVWTSNDWHWHTDHIYRGDQMLASVANLSPYGGGGGTVTRNFHLDHLGTPRLVTQTATEVAFHAYFPFGTEQAHAPVESPEETKKFTGHEFDVDNGLFATDYMHARYYNPSAGRFFSVDPELDTAKATRNPQMWNRYAYVSDNPMRYSDPTGRSYLEFDGENHKVMLYSNRGKLLGTWDASNHPQNKASADPLSKGSYPVEKADRSAPAHHSGSHTLKTLDANSGKMAAVKDANGNTVKVKDDSRQGMYGTYGIVHIEVAGHDGIGVHSGREGVTDGYGNSGSNYATNGCIRTTDDAMKSITTTMKTDPLTRVDVVKQDDRHWQP